MIDPRTLVPLDLDTLAASVRRTGRGIIAHEAVTAGGFGAELAAQLQAAAFDYLEAPIQRVGAPFTPVPVSPPLEDAYRPGADGDRARGDRRARVGPARRRAVGEGCARRAVAAERCHARAAVGARREGEQRRSGYLLEQAAVAEHDLEVGQRQVRVLARDAVGPGPSRWEIASTNPRWWRCATTRISRDSGSWACWRTSALGLANGQRQDRVQRALEQRAVRHLQQARVERLVERDVALERLVVGAADERLDRLVDRAQRPQVTPAGAALGGEAGGRALEHAADLDRVADVGASELADHIAAGGERPQQALVLERGECEAQRGARDAQALDQPQLGHAVTGLELAAQDLLAQTEQRTGHLSTVGMNRHGRRGGVYCERRRCMQKPVRGATAIVSCGLVRTPLHTAIPCE